MEWAGVPSCRHGCPSELPALPVPHPACSASPHDRCCNRYRMRGSVGRCTRQEQGVQVQLQRLLRISTRVSRLHTASSSSRRCRWWLRRRWLPRRSGARRSRGRLGWGRGGGYDGADLGRCLVAWEDCNTQLAAAVLLPWWHCFIDACAPPSDAAGSTSQAWRWACC